MKDKNKEKKGIIVQARMSSTRLPGKVMKKISGKTMISTLIERLGQVEGVHQTIIATSSNACDQVIVEEVKKHTGVSIFCGSEEDVLFRYYEAACAHKLDTIIRVTADCPLADPEIISSLIDYFYAVENIDYASNTLKRTFARGVDAEVFSFQALEKAHRQAKEPYQREHVTPYMQENFRCISFEDSSDNSNFRITVDTPQDYELVTLIFQRLGHLSFIRYQDVIALLKEQHDLVEINKLIKQKEIN